jgi:hypothetical protein
MQPMLPDHAASDRVVANQVLTKHALSETMSQRQRHELPHDTKENEDDYAGQGCRVTTAIAKAVNADVMPRADAERLDKRIRLLVQSTRDNIEKLYQLVGDAKAGQIHESLGYASWTAYVADVFTVEWKIGREERRELVAFLHGEGMSQRAIADVVDVGVGTVNRDLDAAPVPNGTPAAEPPVLTQAEAVEVTGRIRDWVDVGRQTGLGDAELEDRIASAVRGEQPVTTGKDGKTYTRSAPKPEPKPQSYIGRANSKRQLRMVEASGGYLKAIADGGMEMFDDGFEKTFTPELAASMVTEWRAYLRTISKYLSKIEKHGESAGLGR